MKQYWFISYAWKSHGDSRYGVSEVIVDQHPLFWLNDRRKDEITNYQILFYNEIDEDLVFELLCEEPFRIHMNYKLENKLRKEIFT